MPVIFYRCHKLLHDDAKIALPLPKKQQAFVFGKPSAWLCPKSAGNPNLSDFQKSGIKKRAN